MFCQPAGSPSRRRVAPCSSPAWEGSPATEGDRIGRRHRLSAQAEVFTASKPAFPSPALVVSSGHLKIIKRILKFSLCSIHLDFHDGKQGDLFRDHNISYEVERALAASAKGTCGIAKRPLRSDRRHVQPWALEAYLEQFYFPGSLRESKSHFVVSCDAQLIDYHYLRLLICCSQ